MPPFHCFSQSVHDCHCTESKCHNQWPPKAAASSSLEPPSNVSSSSPLPLVCYGKANCSLSHPSQACPSPQVSPWLVSWPPLSPGWIGSFSARPSLPELLKIIANFPYMPVCLPLPGAFFPCPWLSLHTQEASWHVLFTSFSELEHSPRRA